MDTLDKESLNYKIPAFGQHVVCVLFNADRWDGELIPLGGDLPDAEKRAAYLARGLRMVAVFGFLNVKFCAAFEPPIIEDHAISYLSRCYCEWIYKKLVTEAPSKAAADDAVDWLRRLYALPSEDRSK